MRRLLVVIGFLLGGCIGRSPVVAPPPQGSAPVIVELFSNDMCTHCPRAEHILDSLSSIDSNLIVINYHVGTPDPADPFYLRDSAEINGRISYYYGDPHPGTPYVVINGIYEFTGISGASVWEARINELHSRNYSEILTVTGVFNSQFQLSLTVNLSTGKPSDLRTHIVLTESNIRYNSPNGDTLLNHIVFDMVCGHQGCTGTSIDTVIDIPQSISPQNVDVVVFVQNMETGEVLDARMYPLTNFIEPTVSYVGVHAEDTVVSVPVAVLYPVHFTVINDQWMRDSIMVSVDITSLSPQWSVNLCVGGICLPRLWYVDTLNAFSADSTYELKFFHLSNTDPPGSVWVKAWSLTDPSLRDSINIQVRSAK